MASRLGCSHGLLQAVLRAQTQGLEGALGAVLHEDQHLLPVDLHTEVVDQVGMVDGLKDSQLICDIPKKDKT